MKIVSSKSQSDVGAPPEQTVLVVASRAMTELLAMAEGAAKSPATVLITGESGVGKDLVARYIHSHSEPQAGAVRGGELRRPHRSAPRIGALRTRQWKHDRRRSREARQAPARASRYAVSRRSRRHDPAHAGVAVAVSRERRDSRGRFATNRRVDVRVVAATNRNLNDLVAAGQFREDLLYRLRVIHLHVPPLRERAEDVHALMRHFLASSGRDLSFTDDALRALLGSRVAGQRPRAPERRRTAGLVVGGGQSSGSSIFRPRSGASPSRQRRPSRRRPGRKKPQANRNHVLAERLNSRRGY